MVKFRIVLAMLLIRASVAQQCPHHTSPQVLATHAISDGDVVYKKLTAGHTHHFLYTNENLNFLSLPVESRKLILHLEPCKGVVYLFVKKARPCFPDPYSCVDDNSNQGCQHTHFVSELNGTHDGAATFFEIPLSTTKYYISIYAKADSEYVLTTMANTGAYPRPGNAGAVTSRQLQRNTIQVSWHAATFQPATSSVLRYLIYVTLLHPADVQTSKAVVLRPEKIMNTVCGLQNNTDLVQDTRGPEVCRFGICNSTIFGTIDGQRYLVNIVAESTQGYKAAYSGLIVKSSWSEVEHLYSDTSLRAVGVAAIVVLSILLIVILAVLFIYR